MAEFSREKHAGALKLNALLTWIQFYEWGSPGNLKLDSTICGYGGGKHLATGSAQSVTYRTERDDDLAVALGRVFTLSLLKFVPKRHPFLLILLQIKCLNHERCFLTSIILR